MKKTITVLSIASVIIYALTLVFQIVATVFQKDLRRLFYDGNEFAFTIPFSAYFSGICMLFLSILALIVSIVGMKRNIPNGINILLNVALIALPSGVSLLSDLISYIQNSRLLAYGSIAVASYVDVTNIASIIQSFSSLAYVLYMVSAGMRIAFKNNKKN